MTHEEVFVEISAHMVKGLMIHSDYADYYYFINLCEYGDMHKDHYLLESESHAQLRKWYIKNYNMLLPSKHLDYESVIPQSWLKYKRMDVDEKTVRTSVKRGLEAWVEWEKETKELYEHMYRELVSIDDIYGAMYVADLIKDVSIELCEATEYMLNKRVADYGLAEIMQDQKG